MIKNFDLSEEKKNTIVKIKMKEFSKQKKFLLARENLMLRKKSFRQLQATLSTSKPCVFVVLLTVKTVPPKQKRIELDPDGPFFFNVFKNAVAKRENRLNFVVKKKTSRPDLEHAQVKDKFVLNGTVRRKKKEWQMKYSIVSVKFIHAQKFLLTVYAPPPQSTA